MSTSGVSVTEDQVVTAIRSFVLSNLPSGVECAKAQENRVAEPLADNFILMTPYMRKRLGWDVETYDEVTNVSKIQYSEPVQMEVQLDFHGANSTDYAQTIATLFRSSYAVAYFDGVCSPLYSDDGHQLPFINGEGQYETRWVVNLALYANIVVSVDAQFMNSAKVQTIIAADVEYPA